MKSNTCLANILIICIFVLLASCLFIIGLFLLQSGGIGASIGNLLIGDYNPPWRRYQIEAAPKELVDIVHVDIQSTSYDPNGDILFGATVNGEVYSKQVFHGEWLFVDPSPAWDNSYVSDCTTERLGPTESHLWDNPPVEKEVLDSAGIIFERPLSAIVRCYVLPEDGKLEVWVHSDDFNQLIAHLILRALLFVIVAAILGLFVSLIISWHRKRTERSVYRPNHP